YGPKMSSVRILSVDLQHEFALPGGRLYRPRDCVPFLTDVVFPAARQRDWPISEIISDYRDPPRPAAECSCVPGTWAARSLVPRDQLTGPPWVKAAPSPAWTRPGGGDEHAEPGEARLSAAEFTGWLERTVGPPDPARAVVVVGLVLEVCVLSTVQELHYRGYRPRVLLEGVDTGSGDQAQKRALFDALFPFWGEPVRWDELIG
ncbi:MAG TPA: isochorismatase family protein, partial [Mycobacteriales bacterium]|nr:isochorismatase family protein [Mycobacteriales bacterium]